MQTLQIASFAVAAFFSAVAGTFFCGNVFGALWLKLPRAKAADVVLWTAALVWFFWHLCTLDDVDFAGFPRVPVIVLFMLSGAAAFKFIPDLLGLRAIAVLTLFACNELLAAGFNHVPYSLVLAGTAYILVVAALFVGASPYLLRDWLTWVFASKRNAFIAGTLFSLVAFANLVQGFYLFCL